MKLVRHSIYNLLGLGFPLVVAIFSIPILIRALGEARFGLLTLIWAVVSYFGLFDLGLGRALTQRLAVALGTDDHKDVGSLVATSTVLMAGLGVFAGTLMAALAPWGAGLIHDVPSQQEVVKAVYWMAAAMPAIVLTSGFRGILEARQAFGIVNLIRLPMGLITFLGPLLVVYYGAVQLDLIALVLAIGRLIACVVHGWYAWHLLPPKTGGFVVKRTMIKPLCISGGWMTVSNVAGPIMGYLDRFVVGTLVSAQTAAYYATPQELISKLSILPSALMAVVFPQFSKINLNLNAQAVDLINTSTSLIVFISFPAFSAISFFSSELLTFWIGVDFSKNASEVLLIMACGMLINSISFVPVTWLQATGHSKYVAIIHLVELPVFCALLWFGIQGFGMKGAALAWLLRIVLDACLLWLILAINACGLQHLAKRYLIVSAMSPLFIYAISSINLSVAVRLIVLLFIVFYCFRCLIKIIKLKYNF